MLSHVRLFPTPWTVAHQASLPMRLPRQEYWSGLPFPSPGDLSDPGIKPMTLGSPAWPGGFFTTAPPGKTFIAPWGKGKSKQREQVDMPCSAVPEEANLVMPGSDLVIGWSGKSSL